MSKNYISVGLDFLYGCATLQFIRYYSQNTTFYLNMSSYLHGRERLPFQERVLPILFIRPMTQSRWVMQHLVHSNGIFTAERGPFYLLSLLAIVIAGVYTQKLYNQLTSTRWLDFLVYPVFLFTVMWSYCIHTEANYSYPYDILSLAFFTAGLYYIYTRRYLGIFLVVLIGTFNRETTLFLIGIYAIDAASTTLQDAHAFRDRLSLHFISWPRLISLLVVWFVVKAALMYSFAFNDSSENYVRIGENLGRLKIRLLPALLNICGYTIPLVFLFYRRLKPTRFANYLFIFPVWFAVMFYTGVILETRIYGELCSLSAIALVLIMEGHLQQLIRPQRHARSLPVTPIGVGELERCG
jgi:hypothetical protein